MTNLERAKSEIDFLIIFPERVRGNPLTAAANLSDAIGPINCRTRIINSSLISSSFFSASKKKKKKRGIKQFLFLSFYICMINFNKICIVY